jgi:putative hydrolase of the HAD superfamily
LPRATVFVDADNTLWDTDSVFAKAQLNLLERTEHALSFAPVEGDRLSFVRAVDQGLAERHHAGLRYPPRLLARGTALALAGESGDRAAKAAWLGNRASPLPPAVEAEIEQQFFADVSQLPELRPGVEQGLTTLRAADCLVLVITEATRRKTEVLADNLGLSGQFSRVIEGRKRPALYTRLVRFVGTVGRAYMVGDQLDRDIAPAKSAKLETIYFPGNFRPRWQLDENDVGPDYRIVSFSEVPDIVLAGVETAAAAGRL